MLIKDINPDAQSGDIDGDYFYPGGGSTRDTFPKSKDVLKMIVDEPCLKACEYLFDCNIRTMNSSANKTNIDNKYAYITIDYYSLSDRNKEIAKFLMQKGLIKAGDIEKFNENNVDEGIDIIIPIDENSTSEDVSKKMMEIASFFEEQEILYGSYPREVMEERLVKILESGNVRHLIELRDYIIEKGITDSEYTSFDFTKEDEVISIGIPLSFSNIAKLYYTEFGIPQYYYDEEKGLYWVSKELYDKAQNYLKQKSQDQEPNHKLSDKDPSDSL